MTTMFQSRAEVIGCKPKVLAARSRKVVADIRKRIQELSTPYEEIDNSVAGAVAQVMDAFDASERQIADTQKYLEEAYDP